MAVPDRSDAPQGVDGIPWRRALTFTLNCALQALVVPLFQAITQLVRSVKAPDVAQKVPCVSPGGLNPGGVSAFQLSKLAYLR